MEFPVVRHARFWPQYLNELINYRSYPVKEYVKDKKSAREVVEALIRDIKYPLHMGKPDDTHKYCAYHDKVNIKVEEDYWDDGAEPIVTKIADCDGSAIAACTALRALGVGYTDVLVAFGYVTRDDQVLGGHAWLYARDASFGSDKFIIAEMTLDQPPSKYPVVGELEDLKRPYQMGSYRYVPQYLWNDQLFITCPSLAAIKLDYMEVGRGLKEVEEKYRAINEMWGIKTKFQAAAERSLLFKLRRILKM